MVIERSTKYYLKLSVVESYERFGFICILLGHVKIIQPSLEILEFATLFEFFQTQLKNTHSNSFMTSSDPCKRRHISSYVGWASVYPYLKQEKKIENKKKEEVIEVLILTRINNNISILKIWSSPLPPPLYQNIKKYKK